MKSNRTLAGCLIGAIAALLAYRTRASRMLEQTKNRQSAASKRPVDDIELPEPDQTPEHPAKHVPPRAERSTIDPLTSHGFPKNSAADLLFRPTTTAGSFGSLSPEEVEAAVREAPEVLYLSAADIKRVQRPSRARRALRGRNIHNN